MIKAYSPETISRAELDTRTAPVLLVFGTNWCGHCQAAAGPLDRALERWPTLACMTVEDGPGRPLGRSFRVKLWPTLVLLQHGKELGRLVRPATEAQIQTFLTEQLPSF